MARDVKEDDVGVGGSEDSRCQTRVYSLAPLLSYRMPHENVVAQASR